MVRTRYRTPDYSITPVVDFVELYAAINSGGLKLALISSINDTTCMTHCNTLYRHISYAHTMSCLLYTSDAADEEDSVDLGGRRIIKKKKKKKYVKYIYILSAHKRYKNETHHM
eukprot:TRINITY_DN14972_c0_g1_i4.p1 TRINITY_DN14972_c0_g1~~TRINITY_DN14972_c0_g1_i4.p1  ORF type:complete len:114 (+),score=12.27 TRINITY_DN14972_c0_g1_i4:530-871(+)